MNTAPNDTKMRELILHISEQSEGDKKFGATKLNKLLFYADFLSHLRSGESITGHRYQKLDHGPAPRVLIPILRKMEADGEVVTVERTHYGKTQKRTIALRKATFDSFKAREIALVDQLIRDCWEYSAKQISELSHKFIGWKAARDGEDIPYEVALVGSRRPTQREVDYGVTLEERARELSAAC
jgi:hypothetical protein